MRMGEGGAWDLCLCPDSNQECHSEMIWTLEQETKRRHAHQPGCIISGLNTTLLLGFPSSQP